MNAMLSLLLFATVACLGLPETVFAQPSRSRTQRVDPLTATIRGRVTTADTGAPIRGAEVRLSMDGRFSRLVTTDGEGRYELRSLPEGTYKLIVSRTGFITLEFGQRRPFEAAATIALAEGQSATGNVALIRGGAIFGRVLDPFGDPSVGTRVQVLRVRVEDGRRRLLTVGAGDQTDDTGAFRVYGLPPGDYYVSASTGLVDAVKRDPPVFYPGTSNFAEAQPITLGVGAEASADFQIADALRTTSVSGVVLNSSGAPVAAMVNLRSEAVGLGPSAQSSLMLHDDARPDGTFSIQNVPPGPYTLTAMVMNLPFGPDGTPTSGSFVVPNEAMREQMMNRMPETAAMPIVVGGEDVSGITLVTRRGGRVNGQFVADTGVGRPLPKGLRVTLRSPGAGNMTMTMGGGNDTDFQLAGVSGPTHLDVEGVPEGWAVKAILLDGDDVTDSLFDLTNTTAAIRVVMTDRLTSVIGTVQSNSEIRDHSVLVFPDDATKWTYPSRYVRTIRAARDGRFEMRGLPPGERYLAAAIDYLEDGEEQDPQLLERLRSRATAFNLGEGEQRSIQLDVIGR
jgi:Carboxypeptidase regulatory-like domain